MRLGAYARGRRWTLRRSSRKERDEVGVSLRRKGETLPSPSEEEEEEDSASLEVRGAQSETASSTSRAAFSEDKASVLVETGLETEQDAASDTRNARGIPAEAEVCSAKDDVPPPVAPMFAQRPDCYRQAARALYVRELLLASMEL